MKHDLPAALPLSSDTLTNGLARLEAAQPRLRRLWTYYQNPMRPAAACRPEENAAERPYRQGQEWGLPARITGYTPGDIGGVSIAASRASGIARKEVVVENDIGWRVDAMVDTLFGRPIVIESLADDTARRAALTRVIAAAFEANGGLAFLQQMALLGAVYGFVDVVVKLDALEATKLTLEVGDAWKKLWKPRAQTDGTAGDARGEMTGGTGAGPITEASPEHATGSGAGASEAGGLEVTAASDENQADTGPGLLPDGALIERLARLVRFELVHPSRVLPLLTNGTELPGAYAQVWHEHREAAEVAPTADKRWWQRAFGTPPVAPGRVASEESLQVELLLPGKWYRFENGKLTDSGNSSLAELPLVHVQNLAVPFEYAGRGDVEPLIPLQDELNSRLSDRAYRITMQSFRMFLGKNIDNFLKMPVGPGRMWSTDNDEAEIQEFGGDERCPSEEAHIADVREAMDKSSGVPPVAAGAIKDRLGQLSSAAALRVTLQALLAKTERKRATYGRGIARLAELTLAWLDVAGVLTTGTDERAIEIHWPSAMPENSLERLREAELKAKLGVPQDVVLREIGY